MDIDFSPTRNKRTQYQKYQVHKKRIVDAFGAALDVAEQKKVGTGGVYARVDFTNGGVRSVSIIHEDLFLIE